MPTTKWKMPFGKHKGTPIEDLDTKYIRNLLEHVPIKIKDLEEALWLELDTRDDDEEDDDYSPY